MLSRRRVFAFGSAAILFLSAALSAQTGQPAPRKLSDAEKKEIQTIQKLVDDAVAGQAIANDLSLAWLHEDLLKAQGNKQYIPFSVTLDPSKAPGGKLSFYWRVIAKDPPAAAPAADAKKDDKKKDARPEFAY